MATSAIRKSFLPLALVLLFLGACSDDDPVTPKPSLWEEVALNLPPGESRFNAIDFNGGHGIALGISGQLFKDWPGENIFFKLQPDTTWLLVDLATIPASIIFLDLALDPLGSPVLAGVQDSGPSSVLLDFRGAAPEYFTNGTRGLFAVEGEGSFMVAGGWAMGGDLWTSTTVGAWNMDDVTPPLTGRNDSGFRDVAIRGNRAVACGFDDGADTLQVILERTTTTDWTKMDLDGNGFRTFYCVALSENGTIFVGGIERAGSPGAKAFLAQRTANGLWTDLVLPDPEGLRGVNDILIASDNTIYLACAGEDFNARGSLLHGNPGKISKEISFFSGGLLQVAEAGNGDIYAVGFRRDESTGDETAVMFKKSP
jgi:hypothetical protein